MKKARPLRKLLRFNLAVLHDRWRVLGQRRWARWLALASLLLLAFVPISALLTGSWLGWIPYLSVFAAQLNAWLRHPFSPRKSVRHPLPIFYFWFLQAVCSAAVLTLIFDAPIQRNEYAFPAELLRQLAAFSLLTTTLPAILAWIPSFAKRCGLALRAHSFETEGPRIYTLLLTSLCGLPWLALAARHSWNGAAEPALVAGFVFVTALLPSILLQHRLWERRRSAAAAALPQAFAWSAAIAAGLGFLREPLSFPPTDLRWLSGFTFEDFSLALLLLWVLYELAVYVRRRLHYPPVQASRRIPDEALSAQTDPALYVDTTGAGERLVRFIARSDGGVIGITGVRGAGKSALIAHVLSRLEKTYLTLPLTAPIRHDPGMGFLMNVCRVVCRRVVDDVGRGLFGRKTERTRALAEILRRIRNLLVGATVVGIGVTVLVRTRPSETSLVPEPSTGSVCSQALAFERRVVDDLLKEIDAARLKPGQPRSPFEFPSYLVVPRREGDSFGLLPTGTVTAVERMEVVHSHFKSLTNDYHSWVTAFFPAFPRGFVLEDPDAESALRAWGQVVPAVSALPIGTLAAQSSSHSVRCLANDAPLVHHVQTAQEQILYEQPKRRKWLSVALADAFSQRPIALVLNTTELTHLYALLRSYRRLLPERDKVELVPVMDAALSFVPALGILVALGFLAGPVWKAVSSLVRSMANWRHVALYREAQQFLELLHFSESREVGASLSWRGIGVERSRALAARDLTLPGLTSRYTEFVQSARTTLYNGKIVVAIDELDKIHDPEMIKGLLTEVKGALFAKGCFYLISISEDATRSFRKRLSSGRDIIESTFDDIVEIRRMDVAAATQMIQKRLGRRPGRIGVECYFVLALFGGGIPREIVRYLREVRLNDSIPSTPQHVSHWLLLRELEAWLEELGEVELPGAAAIELRQRARGAVAALAKLEPSCSVFCDVWDHLSRALDTIDPEKLRLKVNLLPPGPAEPMTGDVATYRALVDDIQACLRLMLLAVICELACGEDGAWRPFEQDILGAFTALADKPALAEQMLGEIRTTLHPQAAIHIATSS